MMACDDVGMWLLGYVFGIGKVLCTVVRGLAGRVTTVHHLGYTYCCKVRQPNFTQEDSEQPASPPATLPRHLQRDAPSLGCHRPPYREDGLAPKLCGSLVHCGRPV